jgi:hypothetical protein
VRKLLLLVVVAGLALWAWRSLLARREPHEYAGVSYSDGSALMLEPGSAGFESLAGVARSILRS